MTRRLLTSAVAALVLNLVCMTSAPARPSVDKDAQFAAKVKAEILELGTGPAARVQVKLRDGTKLNGYVRETAEDHFVFVEEHGGPSTDVPYAQVKQFKQVKGNNLTKGAEKVVAVAGALVAVVVILFFVQRTGR